MGLQDISNLRATFITGLSAFIALCLTPKARASGSVAGQWGKLQDINRFYRVT